MLDRIGVFRYLIFALGFVIPVRLVSWFLRRHLVFDENIGEELIFCLKRASFEKDIQVLRSDTPLNFVVLDRGYTVAQFLWFPPKMQIQTYFVTFTGALYDRALRKSEAFFTELFDFIEKTKSIDGVFSANFDYWQEAGLFRVAKKREKKVLILSREHPVVPKAVDTVRRWYLDTNFKLTIGKIAVAGPTTKSVLVNSGVCAQEQVLETGLPRFDPWIGVSSSISYDHDRDIILLMSFADGYYADKTFKDVLDVFVMVAKEHKGSGRRFVIKAKDDKDAKNISSMIKGLERQYLEVTFTASLYHLLPKSAAVVGYNSLALVEAVLAKCPLILPAWGQCKDDGFDVMYSRSDLGDSKIAEFAYSRLELKDELVKYIDASEHYYPTDLEILDFAKRFVFFDFGVTSSERVYLEFKRL